MIDVTVVKTPAPGSSATANHDKRVRVALCCEAFGSLFVLMCEEFSVHLGEKAGF